jgi:hypothetical protein
MAQATRDSQGTNSAGQPGELDESVGELIDQLSPEEGSSLDLTPGAQVGDLSHDGISEQPPDAGSEEELLQSVQALLREVPGPGHAEPGPPPGQPRPAASDAPAELELPEDLLSPKADEPPPAEPDPEDAAKLETLDEELAGLADELISSELAAEPEPPTDDGPTLEAAVAATAAAPQPAARAAPETPSPEPRPSPFAGAPAAPSVSSPETGPEVVGGAPLVERLARPLLVVCAAASAPLKDKPQHVRDRIGWHAMWLAFLGVCVWTYVLFIRSPEAPVPTLPPPQQASADHAPPRNKSAEKDSHGSAKKTDSKKSASKKPDSKKQASAGH